MKEELSGEMESKIIDSATKIFIRKGKKGASMQDIAEEANINRTLLNYYFRSKDKLFDAVFEKVFAGMLPVLAGIMNSNDDIFVKFENFFDSYTELLIENPMAPLFILHEITTNPELMINAVKDKGINPTQTIDQIKKEMERGKIKKMDPRALLVNLLALIIFPFAGRPLIEGIMFQGDKEAFDSFLVERRSTTKEFFLESIKP